MSPADKSREYYHENKERILANRRKRYELNPHKFLEQNGVAQRKRRTGFTREEYKELLSEQNGRCFICETVPKRSLAADHCHKTGTKRRLLCGSCNRGLGLFKDNPQILEKAAEYLRAHGG